MAQKLFSTVLFLYLIGSTLCLIPEGEYQFGPVFPSVGKFFGNKYFEAFVDKGQLKPLLAKKVLLGVGAVGAVAAAGGAALIAKKIHESKGFGHGYEHGGGNGGGWYPPTQTSGWSSYPSSSYPSSNDYGQYGQQGYTDGQYAQQGYTDGQYAQQSYAGNVNFPASQTTYEYPSQGYNTGGYEDHSSSGYNYDYGQSNGYSNGWSR